MTQILKQIPELQLFTGLIVSHPLFISFYLTMGNFKMSHSNRILFPRITGCCLGHWLPAPQDYLKLRTVIFNSWLCTGVLIEWPSWCSLSVLVDTDSTTQEEELSVEELPQSDRPLGVSVERFSSLLIDDKRFSPLWAEPVLGRWPGLCKKGSWASQGMQPRRQHPSTDPASAPASRFLL